MESTGSIADMLGHILHGTKDTATNTADVFNSIINMARGFTPRWW